MSSDTTAFLAGCAITGVAAVLLLRGGLIDPMPRGTQSMQVPPTAISPPPSTLQVPNSDSSTQRDWQFERELEQQTAIATDLKSQLERQLDMTEDLKTSLEQQRNDTEKTLAQLQLRIEEQQRVIDAMTVQQQISTADRLRNTEQFRLTEQARLATSSDQPVRVQSTILWVVGITIIVLAVGGGIILLVLVVLLVQSQRRYPRPVHVIHPMANPYVLPEQALLPSSTRPPRRTSQIEIYED